jgi:DNA-binding transcriptional LysR family regulator
MRAKILAQREGLGVGWVPKPRAKALLDAGELVEKRMADPREPNTLYVAWRGDSEGRALTWWIEQFRQPRLAKRLIQGIPVVP